MPFGKKGRLDDCLLPRHTFHSFIPLSHSSVLPSSYSSSWSLTLLSICQSIHPSISPFTPLPIHPSAHLPIFPSTHPSIHSSSHTPILPYAFPPTHPPIHLATYPSAYLASHPPIFPHTHPPMLPSIHWLFCSRLSGAEQDESDRGLAFQSSQPGQREFVNTDDYGARWSGDESPNKV